VSLDLDEIRERAVPVSQGAYRCVRREDFDALVAEVERLRAEVSRERSVVLDYLAYRIEMSHYSDAIREFINARDEISEGVHHTIDYSEVLP
jgi:hypothetical protein